MDDPAALVETEIGELTEALASSYIVTAQLRIMLMDARERQDLHQGATRGLVVG